MPTLHWIGKDKVINHHLDVPYRVLDHQYSFDNGQQSEIETQSGNKIIHGDNLEALKTLLPEYEGRVKCIYIDPPYNTGNEGWAYNDNVNDPRIKKWLHSVVGKEGDDLSRHDKWLCMMYPRLKLLHKLLSKDGSIFISLDENEITNVRLLLNEIFGERNFVTQITLLCNPKGRSQDKYFSTNHEYCIVYSKNPLPAESYSITKASELINKEYKLQDDDGQFRLIELRNTHREFNRSNRPNLFYPIYVNPDNGKVSLEETDEFKIPVFPLWPDNFEGCWTWGKDLAKSDIRLLIAKKANGKWKVYRKSYSQTAEGANVKKKLFTIWNNPLFYTEKGQAVFGQIFPGLNKNDFPQPKAVEFVKEVLRSATDKDAIVLDSFAGSGTTAHALLELNKEDGGRRKVILVEMATYADSITAERTKRVISGYNENTGTGGAFDFYELGQPLFKESGELNEAVGTAKLRQYIYYTETNTPLANIEHQDNQYYLNTFNHTNYYFYYEPDALTTLNEAFLSTIKTKAEQYIIYADNCLLNADFMSKQSIIFKKIPRDITKF